MSDAPNRPVATPPLDPARVRDAIDRAHESLRESLEATRSRMTAFVTAAVAVAFALEDLEGHAAHDARAENGETADTAVDVEQWDLL